MSREVAVIAGVPCTYLSWPELEALFLQWLKSGQSHHVVTLNAEMVVLAQTDTPFRSAMEAASVRIPEGGLVWARNYLEGRNQRYERLAGVDVLLLLARLCVQAQERLFLLGASVEDNEAAQAFLRQAVPGLDVQGLGGRPMGDAQELTAIREAQPGVLAVAFGAPKQTLWIDQYLPELPSVRIAIGVGGALDILSGRLPRAPQLFVRFNMEWLWRWILEPTRARRMYRATWEFMRLVYGQKRD